VLEALKADPVTASIPVVMVSSMTLDDSERAQYGAAAAILHKDALGAHTLRTVLAQTSLAAAQHAPSSVFPAEARQR
jgi:hypothetical protein